MRQPDGALLRRFSGDEGSLVLVVIEAPSYELCRISGKHDPPSMGCGLTERLNLIVNDEEIHDCRRLLENVPNSI